MGEKLKPCPFCGNEGEENIRFIESYLPFTTPFRGFYCSNCGGSLISGNINHSYNDIKNLWNRRAEKNAIKTR